MLDGKRQSKELMAGCGSSGLMACWNVAYVLMTEIIGTCKLTAKLDVCGLAAELDSTLCGRPDDILVYEIGDCRGIGAFSCYSGMYKGFSPILV